MRINAHIPSKRLGNIKKKNGLTTNALYVDRTFGASIEDSKRNLMIITKTYLWMFSDRKILKLFIFIKKLPNF